MKFKHQKPFKFPTKKLIVLISAFSIILSTVSFCFVSADTYRPSYTIAPNQGVDNYQVTQAVPAIPMYAATTVDKYYLEFEFEEGQFVEGTEVSITLDESVSADDAEILNGNIIDAKKKGIYKATATYGEAEMTVYIVARDFDDAAWYLYDEDFTQTNYNATSYSDIEIPSGWKSQYKKNRNSKNALSDFTYVGKYPANSDITSGIVPFYDTYLSTGKSTANEVGLFTLNNSVVKDFRDYTISMESMIYNHYYNKSDAGIGLYGRAPVNADGKIYNSSARDQFTIFGVNNGFKADGSAYSTYSSRMWRLTVGDGFYTTKSPISMGNATNVNKALYGTGKAVSVPMSLKFDGSEATYTVAGTSYTLDLNDADDDTPLDKGAVGVVGYKIGDGKANLDISFAMQRFSVALNNGDNDCPAYHRIHPALYQPADNQGVIDYKVSIESPAIPMYVNTSLDKYYLEFELENGVYTEGDNVAIQLDSSVTSDEIEITNNGQLINAKKKGIYKAKVTFGSKEMTVYIIVRGVNDEAWYIYDEDFTKGNYNASSYTDIEIPAGWKAQYFNLNSDTALGDITHVAPYSIGVNVSSGIIPLYSYQNVDSSAPYQRGSTFTLSDPLVMEFSDYTINMNSLTYNHWPNQDDSGVGLFGRLGVDENGKIANIDGDTDSYTIFVTNNGGNSSGKSGSSSGKVYTKTLGNGFWETYMYNAFSEKADVSLSSVNTRTPAQLNMSLKLEGSNATYTTGNSTYTYDLSQTAELNPTYLGKGAVGVFVYRNGDQNGYATWTVIQRFSVALNTADNECPAYYKVYPAVYQPIAGQGDPNYKVSQAVPAIPMITGTSVDKGYLNFEMTDGSYVSGTDVKIELDDSVTDDSLLLVNEGTVFQAKKKGVYKVNVVHGKNVMTAYVVVRDYSDSQWLIYDEDFTQSDYDATSYRDIAIPSHWKSQYAQNFESTTLGDFTFVGKYPDNSNITEGIVPFYDTYLLTDGSSNIPAQQGATFTLNDEVVKSFRDYTISMDSMLYNHWFDTPWAGVGLFGRAPVSEDGKIYDSSDSKDKFTFFAVNNALARDTSEGSKTGDMWYATIGDGFYNQKQWVLGKATNVEKSVNNTGTAVPVSMSLKYDESNAIYTVGETSYTTDLSTVNDDTPLDKGAVGVAGFRIADGSRYLDIALGIKHFTVALNNSVDECPAYLEGFDLDVDDDDDDQEQEDQIDAAYDWVEGQGVNGYYTVTKAAPAIPMVKGATVDKAYLKFEFDTEYVYGNDSTITLADPTKKGLIIEGDLIVAQKVGIYLLNVSDGENSREVYVVVREVKDKKWYLYNHDFTKENYAATAYQGEGSIPVPESWASQYAVAYNTTTLKDFPSVGVYPSSSVTTGVVPFYDTYNINDGENKGGLFTLNDSVVNAFTDYTISMKAMVYNHWGDYSNTGIGIYGRAQLNSEGKIADLESTDNFTAFAVNNGYKKNGVADTYSGEAFALTIGDGFVPIEDETLGTADVKKALKNTNNAVSVPMTLKLSGNVATYTTGNTSFRYDLSTIDNVSDYNIPGAVGVFGYGISDGTEYADVWTSIKSFSVALNNSANNCPAYIFEAARGEYSVVEGQGQNGYLVTNEAPAIPMLTNTTLDITYIEADMEFETVPGVDLKISLVGNPEGVTIEDNRLISATEKGVYEAVLTDGSYERTVYIVVKKQNDDYWYIYDENFMFGNYNAKNYKDIPIPEHWKSQYAKDTMSNTLGDFTHVGVYPAGVSAGIVPFYDTYHLGDGTNVNPSQQGTIFTLSDPIVKQFSDYTISMDAQVYGHWTDSSMSGIGLFGRAPVGESGKIANTSGTDRFTIFATNNAYKADGSSGATSGDVWYMTLADGFYKYTGAVLGKATNINKSFVNSKFPVSLPMNLKYEGKTATYTVGDGDSFTCDLSTVSDDNYTEKGSVGVVGYRMADGTENPENQLAIKRFSVRLNNDKNTLPAYRIDVQEVAGAYNYEAVKGQGTTDYLVEESSPAIPMNVGTSVDIKYLDFEVNGKKVDGNGAVILLKDASNKGVEVSEELITAKEPGVYPAFVEVGGSFIDVYIVVKHQKDDTWYLYHEDFTDYATTGKYNKLKMPEGWVSQYGHDMFVTELHDLEYLAPLSYTANVKTGIIPIYDPTKAGHEFQSATAFFFLNDPVVNAFADYTITNKAYVYGDTPQYNRNGVGLLGRADLNAEGKFINQGSAAGFTTFSINPAIKADGNGDEYTGKVFTGVYASGGWLQNGYHYLEERAEGINYSRSGSNVGVKMTMSLEYSGKYATFKVGNSSYKYDLTSDKHEDTGMIADKNYLNKGSVGVTVHLASAKAWTAIQYFSVALNNSVEGNYKTANLNCPAYRIDFVDEETTPKDKWSVGEGEEVTIVSTVDDENKRHNPPARPESDDDDNGTNAQGTLKRIIRRGTSQELLFILLICGVGLFVLLGLGVAAIIVVNSVTKPARNYY